VWCGGLSSAQCPVKVQIFSGSVDEVQRGGGAGPGAREILQLVPQFHEGDVSAVSGFFIVVFVVIVFVVVFVVVVLSGES
jgi:hypothetical protein